MKTTLRLSLWLGVGTMLALPLMLSSGLKFNFFDMTFLLMPVIPLAAFGTAVLVGRSGLWGGGSSRVSNTSAPAALPKPPWSARLVGTLVILFWIAFTLSAPLMDTDYLAPLAALSGFGRDAATLTIVAACSCVTVTLCVLAYALLRRMRAAVIAMLFLIPGFYDASIGIVEVTLSTAEEVHLQKVQLAYTIALDTPVPGAILRVNGVELGELPVTLTAAQFEEQVPVWHEPPDGFEAGEGSTWQRFERPTYVPEYEWDDDPHPWAEDAPAYYAQVRLGDTWGHAMGSARSEGQANDYRTVLRFDFPEK